MWEGNMRNQEAFCRALEENEKSQATIKKYGREIRRLNAFLDGREPDKALMLEYRERLRQQYKPQTVNGKLSAIHAYLKWIGREECRVRFLSVQRRAFIDKSRELSQGEYRRLLDAPRGKCGDRMNLLLLTICATGIRVSELKYVTVEALKKGCAEISLKGKIRVILLPRALREKLRRYAKRHGIRSGCIFCTRSGKPLDRSNIWRDMKRLCIYAKVDRSKVFPHNLRHLFARTYYAIKKDIAHLADILGHSSVETTRIYLAVSAQEHERTLDKMRLII